MSILTPTKLTAVSEALNKIDAAAVAVQDLAAKEPQEFPDRPRLKGLRAISRELAKQEQTLVGLFE